MLVLMYVDRIRNREQFFAISNDRKKLIARANLIAKKGSYVIKWLSRNRAANVTLRSSPDFKIGRFVIIKVQPL